MSSPFSSIIQFLFAVLTAIFGTFGSSMGSVPQPLPEEPVRQVTTRQVQSCGLDRIDQQQLPLDQSYSYPESAGRGVSIYMIDTGIDFTNSELAGRVKPAYDATGGNGEDTVGNGTALATLAAGEINGVAPNASVYSVKVYDGRPIESEADLVPLVTGLVEGINWITQHAAKPAVVNFPFGLPPVPAIEDAIQRSVDSGITFVVEGGATGSDVANSSPARMIDVISVGTASCGDTVSEISSFGATQDIHAPGIGIPATSIANAPVELSGATAAGAITTGAVALYLGENPEALPAEVEEFLRDTAQNGILTGVPEGTDNLLLNIQSI